MGIAMLIIGVFVGRVEITPERHPELVISMQVAFVVFAALCCGGIFASLARGKPKWVYVTVSYLRDTIFSCVYQGLLEKAGYLSRNRILHFHLIPRPRWAAKGLAGKFRVDNA
jgi:hypothetical protein